MPCTAYTRPRRPARQADCPPWCPQAGQHRPDFPDGARVHSRPVGQWVTVSQVDTPDGRLPAELIVVDDLVLTPDGALTLALDLAEATRITRPAAP